MSKENIMKTIKAKPLPPVNGYCNTLTEDIFSFEEDNFQIFDDVVGGRYVWKASLTEEQFNFLRNAEFPVDRLLVVVEKRPNLKDGNQFFMCAGMKQYAEAFTGFKIFIDQKSFHLEYPERWLNIVEQRVLYQALRLTYPNCSFTIRTHSVYIIQCTRNLSVGIKQTDDIQEGNIFNYDDFIFGRIKSCDAYNPKDDQLQIVHPG